MKIFQRFFGPSHAELIDRRINRATELCGDAEVKRVEADFYTGIVLTIDPHTDWWTFANRKQKQIDAQHEYLVLVKKAESAKQLAYDVIQERDKT